MGEDLFRGCQDTTQELYGEGCGTRRVLFILHKSEREREFWQLPLGLIARVRNPDHLSILTGRPANGAAPERLEELEKWEKIAFFCYFLICMPH